MLTGKYRCKLCGKTVNDEPDILDEHLIQEHGIPVYGMCESEEWDSESIYDEYYESNV